MQESSLNLYWDDSLGYYSSQFNIGKRVYRFCRATTYNSMFFTYNESNSGSQTWNLRGQVESMWLKFKVWNSLAKRKCTETWREHIQADTKTTPLSNAFSWMKSFIPKGPIKRVTALVPIMAWYQPGDKPYLNQWWLDYRRIYARRSASMS